jgi:hypothetical protein
MSKRSNASKPSEPSASSEALETAIRRHKERDEVRQQLRKDADAIFKAKQKNDMVALGAAIVEAAVTLEWARYVRSEELVGIGEAQLSHAAWTIFYLRQEGKR